MPSVPRRQAVPVREQAGIGGRRPRRGLRPLRAGPGRVPPPPAPGPHCPPGGPGRAAGRGPPRDHPVRRRTRRPGHGHRGRADRGALHRRAGGARHRTGHRRGARGAASGPGPGPRGGRGARPRPARHLPPVGAGAHQRAGGPCGAGVLGEEGGHRGRLPPAAPGWHAGPRRGRTRPPELRPQPLRPQRAARGGLLRLRPRRVRAGPRAAGLRLASRPTGSSRTRTCPSTACRRH